MNMNADKPDFEGLKRLLKLKRHEKPPPRYFNDFSARVLNRIQANRPADRESVMERLAWESPWLQRVLSVFQGNPVVTGVFGAVACVLLVGGAIYSGGGESTPNPLEFGGALSQAGMPGLAQTAPLFGNDSILGIGNTNPATSLSGASLFDGITTDKRLIVFRPGGN
jgi:hypothetical protein